MPSLIRSTLAIELERNVLTGIAARCKVHKGTGRVVLEDRALKATRDDREVKCIVEDIGHLRLAADMLSSLLVELPCDLARCDCFNEFVARGKAHEELVVQVLEEPCAQKRLGTWSSTQAYR